MGTAGDARVDGRGGVGAVLRLRPLRPADEAAFVAAHRVMAADGFTFGLGYQPGMPWSSYLKVLSDYRAGINLPPRFVPNTFLVAVVAGEIVGRTDIRHMLNDFLTRRAATSGMAC